MIRRRTAAAAGRAARHARLLCVGEAFTDLIFQGLDRVPGAGEELRTESFVATVGGGAVITAVAAARLGLRARVMSALGPDAVARLRAEGVKYVNVIKAGERAAVSVAISTRHDRSFVTFDGVNAQLERRLVKRWRPSSSAWRGLAAPRPAFVHFAFAPRDCRPWVVVLQRLRSAGIVTSWDFGWHEDLAARPGLRALIGAMDYLFLNEREASMYPWTLRKGHTIIKLGPGGSRWAGPHRDLRVPVRRRTPVDTTGAGDAFNGGFLTGLSRGLPPRECLRLGNRVGAASTQMPGGLDGLPRALA